MSTRRSSSVEDGETTSLMSDGPPRPPGRHKKTLSGIGVADLAEDAESLPLYYWPTCAYMGCTMLWACEFVYVTPVYASLGLNLDHIGYAWMAGSVVIAILLPFLGAWSDYNDHPWGRRRIFIFSSMLCAVVGALIYPFAEDLGYMVGDTSTSHDWAIAIAISAIVLVEVGLDTLHAMQRALCADTLTVDTLGAANTFFALNGGVGKVLGYGLGSANLVEWPGLSYFGENVCALFFLGAVVLIITTTATLFFSREKRFVPMAEQLEQGNFDNTMRRMWLGLSTMPVPVARAFVAHFLSACAWMNLYYYGSDWVGEVVWEGSTDMTSSTYYLYLEGVRAASLGFLMTAVVSVLTSFALNELTSWMGVREAWLVSLVWATACFTGLYCVPAGGKNAALALFALLGVPMAAMSSLTWTIVTVALRKNDDAALYCTVFRLAEIWPYIIMGLFSGVFLEIVGDDVKSTFLVSVVLFVAAAIYSHWMLIDPVKWSDEDV